MQQSLTTAPARRSRALIALAAVVGLLVAIAAYSYGSASDRTPTARVQMVLDEDQTGWPFYAAVQEDAEAFVRDGDALVAARDRAGVASGDLQVDRPGDLSVFSVVATASDDATALALADAGAAELIERSQLSRRSTETADLTSLGERRDALESELNTIAATVDSLDPADQSAEAVLARGSLDSVGRELNDVDRAIGDLETAIDATGPAYRALGPASIDEQATSAVLTAVTAGAAAAVLSLLALSFLAGPATTATAPAGERPGSVDGDGVTELDLRSPAPVARSSAFSGSAEGKAAKTKPAATSPATKPPSKPASRPPSNNGGSGPRAASEPDGSIEPPSKATRSTRRANRKR